MGTESFQSQGCRKHAQRRKRRSPEGAAPASLPCGHLGPSGLEAGLVLARGAPDRSRPLAWRQHSPNLGPGSDGGARGLRPGYAPKGAHAARPTWVITPPTGEGVAARNPAPPSRGPPSLCPARIQRRTGAKGRLHALNQQGLSEHGGAGGAVGGRLAHRTQAAGGTRSTPSRAPSPLSSLPPGRARPPRARPGPGFPQSQAGPSRPLPPGCGGAPAHLPPSPSPSLATEAARRVLAFPGKRVPCSRSASPSWRLGSDKRLYRPMKADRKRRTELADGSARLPFIATGAGRSGARGVRVAGARPLGPPAPA